MISCQPEGLYWFATVVYLHCICVASALHLRGGVSPGLRTCGTIVASWSWLRVLVGEHESGSARGFYLLTPTTAAATLFRLGPHGATLRRGVTLYPKRATPRSWREQRRIVPPYLACSLVTCTNGDSANVLHQCFLRVESLRRAQSVRLPVSIETFGS